MQMPLTRPAGETRPLINTTGLLVDPGYFNTSMDPISNRFYYIQYLNILFILVSLEYIKKQVIQMSVGWNLSIDTFLGVQHATHS